MAKAEFHLPDEVKIDVTVTGVREMRFRIWLAMWLIKLAARLMGGVGRIEVSDSAGPKP